MPVQNIDVATIVTHKMVADELASEKTLRNILPLDPPDLTDPTKHVRTGAYRDVLKMLERRRPAITESMLTNLDDIRDAIIYGTLARLFRAAVTAEGDRHHVQWKHWQGEMSAEIRGLKVAIDNAVDVSATSLSVPIDRR